MENDGLRRPILELKDIVFSYLNVNKNDEVKPVLSIDKPVILYPGSRIGIVGDNGSGKSTIVKLILGLQFPQQGSVKLFDQDVRWSNHYPQLGYIGDPSYSPGESGLPTGITVCEVIDNFKGLWGLGADSLSEFEENLEFDSFLEKDVANLSNGQRKKLMALLALGKIEILVQEGKPQILIADEATDGLDRKSKKFILEKVQSVAKDDLFSMLWISHRRDEVSILADKIYELSEGRLTEIFVEGFNCRVEASSLAAKSFCYSNLDKNAVFEILGDVLTDLETSTFKVTGVQSKIGLNLI
jgi:energy-coupling factor transport system ATP-binding protein